ncbi:unnamed protein product [Eruca vesicaria subsp. sativa]|uniref:Uncharacterized protein n=1 Tax=Eruca vesicaria subsp. sativa TaxID=29727 RepID=A0ABC8L105_ERUVS|nr:unnamed protein product [Eruca vesicaria subsp. sativa]
MSSSSLYRWISIYSCLISLKPRDVHQKWIEGGNYELCIEDVRDEIWDIVKPSDPLKITLDDLLGRYCLLVVQLELLS